MLPEAVSARRVVWMVAVVVGLSACTQLEKPREAGLAQAEFSSRERGSLERKLVRTGSMTVTVTSPEETQREVERLVAGTGGFVERSVASHDAGVWMHGRVPAADLEAVMDRIAGLGKEANRSLSSDDVTDEYGDLETRLRNDRALRDRLEQLLARATDVEDVLAIEKEFSRIQSEIETMQARLDRLASEIELSQLDVHLEKKLVLGPLGHLGYGLWWALSKLFVIR